MWELFFGSLKLAKGYKRPEKFESIGHYHDHIVWIYGYAPDDFRPILEDQPVDQQYEFEMGFEEIRENFRFVKSKIKEERLCRIARELIEVAYDAYLAGDKFKGTYALQEFEGLVWPSMAMDPKHVVEAENRAFGEVLTFESVKVTPYPCPGTIDDLGDLQRELLEIAETATRNHLRDWPEGSTEYFAWVRLIDGSIMRITPKPKDDTWPVLKPARSAFRRIGVRIQELVDGKKIEAYVRVEMNVYSPSCMISIIVEEEGLPQAHLFAFPSKRDGVEGKYDFKGVMLNPPRHWIDGDS